MKNLSWITKVSLLVIVCFLFIFLFNHFSKRNEVVAYYSYDLDDVMSRLSNIESSLDELRSKMDALNDQITYKVEYPLSNIESVVYDIRKKVDHIYWSLP